MAVSSTQKGVMIGAIVAAVAALALLWLSVQHNPFAYHDDMGMSQRLEVALKASLVPALCLLIAIGRLANHRFLTPEDIDGSGLTVGTRQAKILQALLQNTLEQTVLAILVYLAWALLLPATWLSAVPAAAIAFALGRAMFFVRYQQGAAGRAFGFALTFYPTAAMLAWLLFESVRDIATP